MPLERNNHLRITCVIYYITTHFSLPEEPQQRLNANFNMQRTTFTLFGFTQPFTAFPVIEDISNNAKGFTSRMLWFLPRPVFCKMRDNILDQEESNNVEHFKEQLGMINKFYCTISLAGTTIISNITHSQWQTHHKHTYEVYYRKNFAIIFTGK